MKTENFNDLKDLGIVELTKEDQRQIMGGNGSIYGEDHDYGINIDFSTGIAIGGALASKKLGGATVKTSDTASNFL